MGYLYLFYGKHMIRCNFIYKFSANLGTVEVWHPMQDPTRPGSKYYCVDRFEVRPY